MLASRTRFQLFRYAMMALVTAMAICLAHLPLFDAMQFAVFLFAVTLSAWLGGFGPGLLAAALSFLALQFFFMPPIHSFYVSSADDWLRLVIFACAALAANLCTRPFAQRAKRAFANASGAVHAEPVAVAFQYLASNLNGEALFLLDRRGTIVTWNPEAERLTGFSEIAILHEHFSRLFPTLSISEGRPQIALQHAASRQATHEDHACLIRPDGTPFTAWLAVKALRAEDNHYLSRQSASPTEPCDGLQGFLVKLTQVASSEAPAQLA